MQRKYTHTQTLSYTVHVVNIGPHGVQWNLQHEDDSVYKCAKRFTGIYTHTKSSVVVDDLLDFLKIMIAPPTLMESEGPVGRHVRSANHLLILLDHCLGIRTKEEVKIKDTYMYME